MRKFMILAVMAAVVVTLGLLPRGTSEGSPIDPYADSVVAVSGTFGAPTTLSDNPALAAPLVLGAPDANFIQISDNSSITLAFVDNVAHSDGSTSGADLRVHTYDQPFPAAATIEASGDGVAFVPLNPPPLNDPARACLGDTTKFCNYDDNAALFIDLDFDAAGLTLVTHVRLTDLPVSIDGEISYPLLGFDLDAVEALNSGTVACASPPPGMVSWWPGDGNTSDIVGANDGTLQGGATFAPGKVGQAFSLDGVDDYVEVADDPSLDLTEKITVDGWVYPTSRKADHQNGYLVDKQNDFFVIADNHYSYDNTVSAGLNYPPFHLDSGVQLPLNQWSHIAFTYDKSTYTGKIYIDGVEVKSGTFTGSIDTNDDPLRIGCYSNSGGSCGPSWAFPGLIDEVEIFDRALTASEIAAIFDAGSTGKCKVQAVDIDIKPGSDPNCINPESNGVIPVAILGSETFDASTVDPLSVELDGGVIRLKGKSGNAGALEDVNGDGYTDLVIHIMDISLSTGSTTATLTGNLFDGTPITGTDFICIVPRESDS